MGGGKFLNRSLLCNGVTVAWRKYVSFGNMVLNAKLAKAQRPQRKIIPVCSASTLEGCNNYIHFATSAPQSTFRAIETVASVFEQYTHQT
jgi:hypothetical protein